MKIIGRKTKKQGTGKNKGRKMRHKSREMEHKESF
jgi:hypothetical protein